MSIGTRIEGLLAERYITQAELARRVKMSQGAMNGLIRNGGGSKFLPQIARELGTSIDYLRGETDDPSVDALPSPTPETVADQLNSVLVPYFHNLEHGMGGGTYFDEHPSIELIPFNKSWLRSRCAGSLDQLMAIPGRGDSMQPTIMDGDVLLGDRAQKVVDEPDRIWAFGYADTGYVKRLKPLPKRQLRVTSDNKVHDPWDAPATEISIVGRIISVMQWK